MKTRPQKEIGMTESWELPAFWELNQAQPSACTLSTLFTLRGSPGLGRETRGDRRDQRPRLAERSSHRGKPLKTIFRFAVGAALAATAEGSALAQPIQNVMLVLGGFVADRVPLGD